jgi:small subunit ribosomal protein S17
MAETETTPSDAERLIRKERSGVVISASMDKTISVEVVDHVRHRRYNKIMRRTSRLYAHDEDDAAKLGDRVRLMETRPLSKKKRWRLVEILERAR